MLHCRLFASLSFFLVSLFAFLKLSVLSNISLFSSLVCISSCGFSALVLPLLCIFVFISESCLLIFLLSLSYFLFLFFHFSLFMWTLRDCSRLNPKSISRNNFSIYSILKSNKMFPKNFYQWIMFKQIRGQF